MDSINRTSVLNQFPALTATPASAVEPTPAASPRAELPGSSLPGLNQCQKLRGSTSPSDPITVSVLLKSPKQAPGKVGLFKSMSPEEHQQYEASPSQIADIEKFAKANGLTVASVDPATRTVKLTGSAQAQQKAFGVQLNQYKDPQDPQAKPFRAYDGNVTLPKNLAGQVDGVFGLSNRPIAEPRNTGFRAKPKDIPADGFNPADVAKMYNFPKGTDGTGQTIGIVELGGGYNQADLDKYFKKMGIPTPNIKAVSVDGATNAPDGDPNGPDGEVALDIEVAGAMAPGANIVVYFAPNSEQGFIDGINQAAHDTTNKPVTISNSWGSPEAMGLWSPQAMKGMDSVLKDAANMGVNVYTASGDHGSQDGADDGKDHVDFPSASPWNISTGGTHINTDAKGNKTGETAWSLGDDGWGGGGGFSTVFPEPDWQKKLGIDPSAVKGGGRGVPDVAGDADNASGYDVIFDGQEGVIGGTSAVAPMYAALTARLAQAVGQPLGYLAPTFYKHPEAFNDITEGQNGTFKAGPGWDAITGLGSPDGDKLVAAIKADEAAQKQNQA